MNELNARNELALWARQEEQPIFRIPSRSEIERRADKFKKRYGLLLIAAAAFTLYTIILSAAVEHRTETRVRQDMAVEYASQLERYKAEQAEAKQAEYWLSGEASLENQINTETDMLSRVDIWTTDDAYLTFVCNVWVRVLRGDYPNSVEEVLKQEKQYDFYDETKPIDEHRQEITKPLLRKLHSGVFPANLKIDYAWLEMQKDGAVCVLHSKDRYYTNGDEMWRYQG